MEESQIFLKNIYEKYIRDFIRGIVDGDGSIHFDKRKRPTLSICGRKEMMIFIRNHFLSKFDIYSKITQPKKNGKLSNVFYISYRCNSAKTLINYLYNNAGLYLERKFQLAKQSSETEIKLRENYTKEENQIIRQFYHSLPKDKILLMLPDRTWPYIQRHAWEIGLTNNKRRKKKLCT